MPKLGKRLLVRQSRQLLEMLNKLYKNKLPKSVSNIKIPSERANIDDIISAKDKLKIAYDRKDVMVENRREYITMYRREERSRNKAIAEISNFYRAIGENPINFANASKQLDKIILRVNKEIGRKFDAETEALLDMARYYMPNEDVADEERYARRTRYCENIPFDQQQKMTGLYIMYNTEKLRRHFFAEMDLTVPQYIEVFDRYATSRKIKQVLPAIKIDMRYVSTYVHNILGIQLNTELSKLNMYIYFKNKYGNREKEYCLLMTSGYYYNNINRGVNTSPICTKLSHREKIYKNLDYLDYIILLVSHYRVYMASEDYNKACPLISLGETTILHGMPKAAMDIENWAQSYFHKLYSGLDIEKGGYRNGYCLFDFILHEVSKHYALTEPKFILQLRFLNIDISRLTPRNIVAWRDDFYPNISLYCVDAMNYKVIHSPAKEHSKCTICWISHDKHCFPVTDATIKHRFSHTNEKSPISFGKSKYVVSFESGYNLITKYNLHDFIAGKSSSDYKFEEDIPKDNFYDKKVCVLSAGMDGDIYDIARTVMEQFNEYIMQFNPGKHGIVSFVHPRSGQILVLNDELDARQQILAKMRSIDFAKSGGAPTSGSTIKQYTFHGQTKTRIATTIFNNICGQFDESTYNTKVREVFDAYKIGPLVQTLDDHEISDATIKGFDIIKSYSNAMLTIKCKIPIFDIHCAIEELHDGEPSGIIELPNNLPGSISEYGPIIIKPGKYYIDMVEFPYKCGGNHLALRCGWYTNNIIAYLLNNCFITMSDIKYKCLANKYVDGSKLNEYPKFIYNNFDSAIAKDLVNLFIGHCGTMYKINNFACVSTDADTVFALAMQNFVEGAACDDYSVNALGKVYIISKKQKTRLLSDNLPIWESLVAEGMIGLLDLVSKSYMFESSELIGVSTDSCFVTNPRNVEVIPRSNFEEFHMVEDPMEPGTTISVKRTKANVNMFEYIGKYSAEAPQHLKMFHEIEPRDPYVATQPISTMKGILTMGGGGCGKTWTLCEEAYNLHTGDANLKMLFLSFTNKAVKRIRNCMAKYIAKKGYNTDMLEYMGPNLKTFCKYHSSVDFLDRKMSKLLGKCDYIFVDEFFMTPNRFVTILYNSKCPNIRLYGDPNQLEPVEPFYYDYVKSPAIMDMCPTFKTLPYISESRFTKKLMDVCEYFRQNHALPNNCKFSLTDPNIFKNICYTNKCRISVNTDCCDRWLKIHNEKGVVICCNNEQSNIYDDRCIYTPKYGDGHIQRDGAGHAGAIDEIEKYTVCGGMPVIATQNMKEFDICNSEIYKITRIDRGYIFLNHTYTAKKEDGTSSEVEFKSPIRDFGKSFVPAFCTTVHKFQGDEIDEPYNIFEITKMTWKLFYTAITRSTKYKYIHTDAINPSYVFPKTNYPVLLEADIFDGGVFRNAKIYEVKFSDNTYYVGFTTEELEGIIDTSIFLGNGITFRLMHLNPIVSLIHNFPCFERREVEIEKKRVIADYIAKYGKSQIRNTDTKALISHTTGSQIKIAKVELEPNNIVHKLKTGVKAMSRAANLADMLAIKDDPKKKQFKIHKIICGVKYEKYVRYSNIGRDAAMEAITNWRDELLKGIMQY